MVYKYDVYSRICNLGGKFCVSVCFFPCLTFLFPFPFLGFIIQETTTPTNPQDRSTTNDKFCAFVYCFFSVYFSFFSLLFSF